MNWMDLLWRIPATLANYRVPVRVKKPQGLLRSETCLGSGHSEETPMGPLKLNSNLEFINHDG